MLIFNSESLPYLSQCDRSGDLWFPFQHVKELGSHFSLPHHKKAKNRKQWFFLDHSRELWSQGKLLTPKLEKQADTENCGFQKSSCWSQKWVGTPHRAMEALMEAGAGCGARAPRFLVCWLPQFHGFYFQEHHQVPMVQTGEGSPPVWRGEGRWLNSARAFSLQTPLCKGKAFTSTSDLWGRKITWLQPLSLPVSEGSTLRIICEGHRCSVQALWKHETKSWGYRPLPSHSPFLSLPCPPLSLRCSPLSFPSLPFPFPPLPSSTWPHNYRAPE